MSKSKNIYHSGIEEIRQTIGLADLNLNLYLDVQSLDNKPLFFRYLNNF